jgi:hypothetical protein
MIHSNLVYNKLSTKLSFIKLVNELKQTNDIFSNVLKIFHSEHAAFNGLRFHESLWLLNEDGQKCHF